MRAERDRRAAILTAEGVKQSQILTAEGEKQSAILRAEGQREAQILQAEGQSKAIETVFEAIHRGDADPKLLAYQYLQVLPQIAQGDSNKVWIIPSEVTKALSSRGRCSRRRTSRRPQAAAARALNRGDGHRAGAPRLRRRSARRDFDALHRAGRPGLRAGPHRARVQPGHLPRRGGAAAVPRGDGRAVGVDGHGRRALLERGDEVLALLW